MRVAIFIKNQNVETGKLSLKREHIQAYWNGLIESIEVFTTDKEYLESYYGDGLQQLIQSAVSVDDYFLANRWVK